MKKNKKFRIYMCVVIVIALLFGVTNCVQAADDPLDVVNNLSSFLFGLLKAVGTIVLGFGVYQFGMSLKSQDPTQKVNGLMTIVGGGIMAFTKEILDIITK